MALAYTKTIVQIKEIVLQNRPKELYAISSKGTVPVLYVDENTIIDESLDIMLWALDNSDADKWIQGDKAEQLELIYIIDNDFKYWLDRYKYFDRYPDKEQDYYKIKCYKFLDLLEQKSNEYSYLFRNTLSISDVAIFPFIRQFANVDLDLSNSHPKLFLWLEKIKNLDLFSSVMIKYKEYSYGEEPLLTDFTRKVL